MSTLLDRKSQSDINIPNRGFVNLSLRDKFKIINDDISKISDEELTELLDNYFENLLVSGEKVIHPDLLSQIFWFKKDFDSTNLIIKHLDNYLKQKKTSIRTNIKKGNFEIDTGLNKLIETYCENIDIFSTYVHDKDKVVKLSLTKLYEQIISDPALISYLKSEVSQLDDSNQRDLMKLSVVLKKISMINPELKSYQWFLFLISSSLSTVAEESNSQSYPVPERFQRIINFRKVLSFYEQVEKYYKFVNTDVNIVLTGITTILLKDLIEIMNTCTIKELISLIHNYKPVLEKIFVNSTIMLEGKNIKDLFTVHFFMFLEKLDKSKQKIDLDVLINCFQEVNSLLNANGNSRDIINNKLSQIFSNEDSQNYLLEKINQSILTVEDKVDESIYGILSMCSNIREKDKFVEKYNRYLVNRILFKPNIQVERNFYNILQSKFNDRLVAKTNKIITDMEYTLSDRENFGNVLSSGLSISLDTTNKGYDLTKMKSNLSKLSVVTTSFNNWDINQQEGILSYETISKNKNQYQLIDTLYTYDKFYQKRYNSKRKLNWYPHFGEVTFTYLNKDIMMLPVQFIVLEHIQKEKTVNKDNMMKSEILSGYNENFRKSVITSLIIGGIVTATQNNLSVSSNIEKISSDFITLFFNSTNYAEVWDKRREEELVMNRKDVLSACANHHVKQSPVTIDALYDKIKVSMTLFDFTKTDLQEVVDIMVSKDYFVIKNGVITKLLW